MIRRAEWWGIGMVTPGWIGVHMIVLSVFLQVLFMIKNFLAALTFRNWVSDIFQILQCWWGWGWTTPGCVGGRQDCKHWCLKIVPHLPHCSLETRLHHHHHHQPHCSSKDHINQLHHPRQHYHHHNDDLSSTLFWQRSRQPFPSS